MPGIELGIRLVAFELGLAAALADPAWAREYLTAAERTAPKLDQEIAVSIIAADKRLAEAKRPGG